MFCIHCFQAELDALKVSMEKEREKERKEMHELKVTGGWVCQLIFMN
jgi:hypothetical protein